VGAVHRDQVMIQMFVDVQIKWLHWHAASVVFDVALAILNSMRLAC
jgi:hypothetical protein